MTNSISISINNNNNNNNNKSVPNRNRNNMNNMMMMISSISYYVVIIIITLSSSSFQNNNNMNMGMVVKGDYIPPASSNTKAKLYKPSSQMISSYNKLHVNERLRNEMNYNALGSFEILKFMASAARREQLEAMLDFNANVIESEKLRAQENDLKRGQARLYRANYPVRKNGYGHHRHRNLLSYNDNNMNNMNNNNKRRRNLKKRETNARRAAMLIAIPNFIPDTSLSQNQHSGYLNDPLVNHPRPAIYWKMPNLYFTPTWSPPKSVKYTQPKPKKVVNYPTPTEGNYAYYKSSGDTTSHDGKSGQQNWSTIKTVPMSAAQNEEEMELINEYNAYVEMKKLEEKQEQEEEMKKMSHQKSFVDLVEMNMNMENIDENMNKNTIIGTDDGITDENKSTITSGGLRK